ncbi:unnamed protein product [Blepharisma stoltei]|uniref:Protein kinase domain-containing protein n=1 Tax=Blepharisma stoltei TaxID=1481888 RepID=A0AAU9IYD6_9CILI|nr:unnamed protein product [Blepharisma stoltei]
MSELSYEERDSDSERTREDLFHVKEEFLNTFQRLYLYQLEFERSLHELSIQKAMLDEHIDRLEFLDAQLPADNPDNVFMQPASRDFSFSNPGTENTTFSFGEIDENIEVGSIYHIPVDLEEYKKIEIRHVFQPKKTGYELTKEFPIIIGETIAERYRIDRIIASTDMSCVLECADLTGKRKTCIKVIENDKRCLDRGLDEIRILETLKENSKESLYKSHIGNPLDYFYFKEHLFIVFELLGETLSTMISDEEYYGIVKEQIKPITIQLLQALQFIHSNNLIHGDLNPENILEMKKVKENGKIDIRIVDFNSSVFFDDELISFPMLAYTAPEIVNSRICDKSDMWSLGCIIAEIYLGRPLFQPSSEEELLYQIQETIGSFNDLDLSMHAEYKIMTPLSELVTDDPRLLDFLYLLLSPNPANRPGPAEALEHTWLI